MNGWLAGQQCPQPAHGCDGVVAETENVPNNALMHLNTCRVNSAPIEGLKRPVAEVAPECLRLVELPRSQLADVKSKSVSNLPLLPCPLPSWALLE